MPPFRDLLPSWEQSQAWVLLGGKGGSCQGRLAAWGPDCHRVAASLSREGNGLAPPRPTGGERILEATLGRSEWERSGLTGTAPTFL